MFEEKGSRVQGEARCEGEEGAASSAHVPGGWCSHTAELIQHQQLLVTLQGKVSVLVNELLPVSLMKSP